MKKKLLIAFLAAALFWPAQVLAVVYIETVEDGEPQTHIFAGGVYYYLEEGRLTHSFDSSGKKCLAVNHDNGLYFEGDCNEMMAGVQAALEDMYHEQTAMMSDEQKNMMQAWARKSIESAGKVDISVNAAGTGKHLGYDVEKHIILVNGTPCSEIMISSAVQKMIEKEFDLSNFNAWTRSMQEKIVTFQKKLMGLPPGDDLLAEAYEPLQKKGYPLKIQPAPAVGMNQMMLSMSRAGDEVLSRRDVTAVEQKSDLDRKRLSVPKGYTRASSWKEFMKVDMQDEGDDD